MINELAFLTDERQLTSRVIKSPCQNTHLRIAMNSKCYHIFRSIKKSLDATYSEINYILTLDSLNK